jgi:hypothetical protein
LALFVSLVLSFLSLVVFWFQFITFQL